MVTNRTWDSIVGELSGLNVEGIRLPASRQRRTVDLTSLTSVSTVGPYSPQLLTEPWSERSRTLIETYLRIQAALDKLGARKHVLIVRDFHLLANRLAPNGHYPSAGQVSALCADIARFSTQRFVSFGGRREGFRVVRESTLWPQFKTEPGRSFLRGMAATSVQPDASQLRELEVRTGLDLVHLFSKVSGIRLAVGGDAQNSLLLEFAGTVDAWSDLSISYPAPMLLVSKIPGKPTMDLLYDKTREKLAS